MNKVALIGRLVKAPEVRYSQGAKPICIARYTLAVSKKFKRQNEPDADFISCVALGKQGEFAEKYFQKGMKIAVVGRIQTGSYTKNDGTKVYTTDVVAEEQEFAESKNAQTETTEPQYQQQTLPTEPEPPTQKAPDQPWMQIPDGFGDELPFV